METVTEPAGADQWKPRSRVQLEWPWRQWMSGRHRPKPRRLENRYCNSRERWRAPSLMTPVATGKEQTGRKIQVHSLRSSARFPNRVGRNRKQRPNGQGDLKCQGFRLSWDWVAGGKVKRSRHMSAESYKKEASFYKVRQVHQRSTIDSDKDLK